MRRLSISSWTLHRLLGRPWFVESSGSVSNRESGVGSLSILDIPGEIAARGIETLELCHFHFPSVDKPFLDEMCSAAKTAGVELFSVLIDEGDVAQEDEAGRRDEVDFAKGWVERAARLGATHARVIAGDCEATPGAVFRSVESLSQLAAFGASLGVKVLTENFKKLGARPDTLGAILDGCDGRVGLCADFGNFPVETRRGDLESVAGRADSLHAKADYPDGSMDGEAFGALMGVVHDAGFDGPISLIYQDGDDTWDRVDEMKQAVTRFL